MITRPRLRHARATTLWGLVIFAALLAVSQFELWDWGRYHDDPLYAGRRDHLRERLRELSASAGGVRPKLVVTFGSSRVHNGFDGETVERELTRRGTEPVCFVNFGTCGTGPMHSLVLLGRLLRDGIVPDLVVIEALPCYFDATQNAENVGPKGLIPLTYADLAWLEKHDIHTKDSPPVDGGHVLYRHRTRVLHTLAPFLLPRKNLSAAESKAAELQLCADHWGCALNRMELDDQQRCYFIGLARTSYYDLFHKAEWGGVSLHPLRQMLRECQQRNMETMVLLMPEGPALQSWYPEGGRARLEQTIAEPAREFGAKLIVTNGWMEEDDFFDSHHLLAPGAKKFSRRFAREVLTPRFFNAETAARPGTNAVR